MKTAEQLIQEYLERGYSLESLRILAESREQPLSGEMLALLDAMAASAAAEESGTADVACETGAYARVGEEMVFFVADDEPAAAGDAGVDFDLMAATASGASDSSEGCGEESVAELLIGDSPEAEMVAFKTEAVEDDSPCVPDAGDAEGLGIWSRLWSHVSHAVASEPSSKDNDITNTAGLEQPVGEDVCVPFVAQNDSDEGESCQPIDLGVIAESEIESSVASAPVVEPEAADERPVEEAIAVDAADECIPAEVDSAAAALPGTLDSMLGEETVSVNDEAVSADGGNEPAVASESLVPVPSEGAFLPALTESELFGGSAASEISTDYLPGTIAELYQPEDYAELDRAASMVDESEEPVAEEERADAETGGAALENALSEEPVAEQPALPAPSIPVLPGMAAEKKTNRKERRRRERAEKKKAKRGQKNVADELPEIVLTRAEDTGILVPEGEHETREFGLADELPASQAIPEAVAPQLVETTDGAEREQKAAETKRMGDVLSERSLVVLDALAETARESLVKAYERGNPVKALPFEPNRDADHFMIIANGGVDPEEVAMLLADSSDAGQEEEAKSESANIILFHEQYPVFAGETADDSADLDDGDTDTFSPVLRLLPPVEETVEAVSDVDSVDENADTAVSSPEPVKEEVALCNETIEQPDSEPASEAVAATVEPVRRADVIDDEDRLNILFALVGDVRDDGSEAEDAEFEASDHVIVGLEPETESAEVLLEREIALRSELEDEYQSRLDAFATRLLTAQAATAASEARVEEKKAELDARSAILSEMRDRLGLQEEKQNALLHELDKARSETRDKEEELTRFQGLQDEHGRLFKEFEDLRKAYNEIVTDVMPGMQEERDDLAMTIERQCRKESTLRANLNSSRKRLAACYTLAAASCLMLIALPVSNWLKTGEENRQPALDRQSFTQLQDTLNSRNMENIEAQNRIVELERKFTMARDELAKLQIQNRELSTLAMGGQHAQGIAVFRPQDPTAGTPTRASTMALQGSVQPGSSLHVNEVMDPAGSIEELVVANRQRNTTGQESRAQMAQTTRPQANIPVSAVASTQPRNSMRPSSQSSQTPARTAQRPVAGATALRPQAGEQTAAIPARAVSQPRADVVTATVRRGEGVAQVVYRVLGSRDPDVIAWVIDENKIRSDRRGNPIIQPDQELKLPKDGRIGQAANAQRRGVR